MPIEPVPLTPDPESGDCAATGFRVLKIAGWFSAGLVVAAASVYLGFELRSRYLFKRRTPYDFYSSDQPTTEFGMGI